MSWTVAQVAMAVSSQATRPRVGSVLSLIGVRRLPVSRGAVSFVSAAPDFVTWGKLPHTSELQLSSGKLAAIQASLAPHERLPELPIISREKPHTGAAARENP